MLTLSFSLFMASPTEILMRRPMVIWRMTQSIRLSTGMVLNESSSYDELAVSQMQPEPTYIYIYIYIRHRASGT